LVAYHSCAQIEAEVRGLGAEMAAEFSPADPLLSDVLLYCDMTTGPGGNYVRPADRLVEIRGRYGPDHEVTRFVELRRFGIANPSTPGDKHEPILSPHRR
jgi:hypothetical protein